MLSSHIDPLHETNRIVIKLKPHINERNEGEEKKNLQFDDPR
jgi:hypothetical protein